MSLIDNERTKLTATCLNTLASGTILTGGVAPVIGAFYGIPGPAQVGAVTVLAGSAICLVVGAALHFFARAMLRRLQL